MTNLMTEVRYKPAYEITHGGETNLYDTLEEALAALDKALTRIGNSIEAGADFIGSLLWDYDEEAEPASPLDALVARYISNPHGGGGLDSWRIDRDAPYLLVEESGRGGYWLTSFEDVKRAILYHEDQDSEWELIGIFDTATGKAVNFTVHRTVEILDETQEASA